MVAATGAVGRGGDRDRVLQHHRATRRRAATTASRRSSPSLDGSDLELVGHDGQVVASTEAISYFLLLDRHRPGHPYEYWGEARFWNPPEYGSYDIDPWSVAVAVPAALGTAAPDSAAPGTITCHAAAAGIDVAVYEVCDRFLQCNSAEFVIAILEDH